MISIEQQIAQAESKLARLKVRNRKLETAQKIIVGGAVLTEAKENREFAEQLISILEARVTRKADTKRLTAILDKLKSDLNKYCMTERERADYDSLQP